MYDPKERAVEAVRLLNHLLSDFTDGVCGFQAISGMDFQPRIATALNRMVISHLVLSLSKWTEFYKRYHAILPTDVGTVCRNLYKQIGDRGIVHFRNTVVGHIIDDDTKQTLTSKELDERLKEVIGDQEGFLQWIYDPSNNCFPDTVAAITRHVRDKLCTKYKIPFFRPYEVCEE